MFFVVDKNRLQRLISLTRDDVRPKDQGRGGPFFRIEAVNERIKLTGRKTEAEFPATVYEPGVLFLRVTLFRRLLQSFTETPTIAIQVSREGLQFGDVTMPLESNEMLLYLDPARAPREHPRSVPPSPPADPQGTLF